MLPSQRENRNIITLKVLSTIENIQISTSAYDSDPLDPQHFGFLDPDPQKYAYLRIRIQGAKYQ